MPDRYDAYVCFYCEKPVDPTDPRSTYRRVLGWQPTNGKGPVVGSEAVAGFACLPCVRWPQTRRQDTTLF